MKFPRKSVTFHGARTRFAARTHGSPLPHTDHANLSDTVVLAAVVRLHRRLSIESDVTNLVDGTVVFLGNAGRPCGLFVDEMVSNQQVLVNSLGSTMLQYPGNSGGAILGDGSIALILDPTTLVKVA